MGARVTMYFRPSCGFCQRADALLRAKGVTVHHIRTDLDPEARQTMIARTGRSTVPQIFIDDTHVGGCDDLMALERAGQLDPLLAGERRDG